MNGKSARVLCVVALAALSGCVGNDLSDLEQYVEEVKSRRSGKIKPLPEVKPYKRHVYQSAELRDPFVPLFQEPKEALTTAVDDEKQRAYVREINERRPEELENFELDSLRMVGTLEDADVLWGIIRDGAGTVHRVQVGNYLGRNYGRITSIYEDRIELREIVRDPNQGHWEERQAAVALYNE